MNIMYCAVKVFRKIFNRAAINNSKLEKTVRVDVGSLVINSSIMKHSYVGEHTSIIECEVGAFTSISNYCAVGGGAHPIDWVSTSPVFNSSKGILKQKLSQNAYNPFRCTRIGNDVWIGSHCLIKAGVTIGNGAIVGMGSVVTSDVGPYEIWAGNPARCIRKRFSEEMIFKLKETEWWELSDIELSKMGILIPHPEDFVTELEKQRNL